MVSERNGGIAPVGLTLSLLGVKQDLEPRVNTKQGKCFFIQGTYISDQHKQDEELKGGRWEGQRLDIKDGLQCFSCENGSPLDTTVDHKLKRAFVLQYTKL